jgi:hypothetical protein
VTVEVQAVDLIDGTRLITAPKSEAGRRTVHLPMLVVEALAWHLKTFPPRDGGAAVFAGPLSDHDQRTDGTPGPCLACRSPALSARRPKTGRRHRVGARRRPRRATGSEVRRHP